MRYTLPADGKLRYFNPTGQTFRHRFSSQSSGSQLTAPHGRRRLLCPVKGQSLTSAFLVLTLSLILLPTTSSQFLLLPLPQEVVDAVHVGLADAAGGGGGGGV